MTARSTLRSLSYLLSEAWYALRSAPSALATADGMADALADAEAMEEVAEPQGDCGLGGGFSMPYVDGFPDGSVFAFGGQTVKTGPRPRLSTPGPRRTDSDRLDRIISLLDEMNQQLYHIGNMLYYNDIQQTSAAPVVPAHTTTSNDAAESPAGPEIRAHSPAGHPTPRDAHKQALSRALDEDRKTTTATTEGI